MDRRDWLKALRSTLSARRLAVAVVASALCACAWLPMRVDRSARAPALPGFGRSDMAITTASDPARRYFAQGMEQAYAFNEAEAVRAFKAALAQDPSCAMCAWGVAHQLGPNINATDRGDLTEAVRYVTLAESESAKVSRRERDLIEALALRYGRGGDAREAAVPAAPVCGTGGGGEKAHPLDIAYAERMRLLADRYPDDADVLSMYAEAEMIATRDDWWNPKTGQPAGRMGDVAQRLEALLVTHPDHVGLNHYMIHAVDAPGVAARAEGAADRLGELAQASPHLLHMPSHTFVRLGRYADASRVNEQALAADDAQDAELARQGFQPSKDWRSHDGNFLWYAALMEGRGELALKTARASATRAKGESEFAEFARSRPILTLLRLERWNDVLQEPPVADTKGLAAVIGDAARGVALARTGQTAQAAEMLARVEPAAAKIIDAHPGDGYVDKMLRGVASVTRQRLRAEVALAQGRGDAAVADQIQTIALAKDVDDTEPPLLAAGTRLTLGDIQLQTKRWSEAEQTFRADLADHPKSGWARRGLALSLRAQGRAAESDALRAELRRDWASADPQLLVGL